jgi:hypothetical protein
MIRITSDLSRFIFSFEKLIPDPYAFSSKIVSTFNLIRGG